MMSLNEIKKFIEDNDNFAIIGHANPDGDCVGSCLGMWYMLRKLGKCADVCINSEDVPHHLKFIWNNSCSAKDGQQFDAYIAIDCAGADRLSTKSEEFAAAERTACIDHHRTNTGFAKVNAVIPDAAAAGEIIYYLAADIIGITPIGEMADAIYTAIVSDTGGFKYSSTTARTMRAGASLLENGVESALIFKNLFDTYTKKQIDIVGDITSTLTMHFNGKVAVIYVTDELLESKNMRFDEVDFITNLPRSIEGVEVGVFLKKRGDEVKISLRSGESVDVSQIAASLGGGGHMRAAGITLKCCLDEAKETILKEIEKVI
ncbi:MAG: bifunctional oligoribonuclease/PAP phosphatase NrnA [Clostridia bacterium]|nr:bifunctional oligoribonuclease/PAP phosphatase NrnA [Clostridia bacterium]